MAGAETVRAGYGLTSIGVAFKLFATGGVRLSRVVGVCGVSSRGVRGGSLKFKLVGPGVDYVDDMNTSRSTYAESRREDGEPTSTSVVRRSSSRDSLARG